MSSAKNHSVTLSNPKPPSPLKHSILHTSFISNSFDREWQQQDEISAPWSDILGTGLSALFGLDNLPRRVSLNTEGLGVGWAVAHPLHPRPSLSFSLPPATASSHRRPFGHPFGRILLDLALLAEGELLLHAVSPMADGIFSNPQLFLLLFGDVLPCLVFGF
jgi:hypothetical protein